MIPNLTIIITTYCILRLLWHVENARVGIAGKPHWVYTALSIVGAAIIALFCFLTIWASVDIEWSTPPPWTGRPPVGPW